MSSEPGDKRADKSLFTLHFDVVVPEPPLQMEDFAGLFDVIVAAAKERGIKVEGGGSLPTMEFYDRLIGGGGTQ